MKTMQKAALWFGALNLVLGLSGFFGPFVTGNRDGLINIETGQLFGLIAINWAHALLLLAFGLYGIAARSSHDAAVTYLWSVAVVFSLLALLGLLGQAGWMEVRGPEGTLSVFEIAVDTAAILLHLTWAAFGLFFALRAGEATQQQERQPARA